MLTGRLMQQLGPAHGLSAEPPEAGQQQEKSQRNQRSRHELYEILASKTVINFAQGLAEIAGMRPVSVQAPQVSSSSSRTP